MTTAFPTSELAMVPLPRDLVRAGNESDLGRIDAVNRTSFSLDA